jgi:hypothetical protein
MSVARLHPLEQSARSIWHHGLVGKGLNLNHFQGMLARCGAIGANHCRVARYAAGGLRARTAAPADRGSGSSRAHFFGAGLWRDRRGASVIEYSILVAVIIRARGCGSRGIGHLGPQRVDSREI